MNQARGRDTVRFGVLALVAFVVAHNATFLISHGASYGTYLARTGHGDRWTSTVLATAGLGIALGIAGIVRLVQLARLARVVGGVGTPIDPWGGSAFAGRLVRSWAVIFPVAMALFVAVENLEHVAAGLAMPGLTVLGSIEYQGTLVVFAVIVLLVAFVDSLYAWRRDVLVARIAAGFAARRRRVRSSVRPALPWVEHRHSSIAGNLVAGRAPPTGLAA